MMSQCAPPVHRLPPEILRNIFRLVSPEQSNTMHGHDAAPTATYLSHVCGKWRHVALDMQELWSAWPRYKTVDESWTMLCCSRAQTAPLDLEWHISYTTKKDRSGTVYIPRVRQTLPHASRARSLAIHIDMDYAPGPLAFWREEVLPAISVPFPLLEDFYYFANNELSEDDTRILKPSLFGGVCPPRLRKMSLFSCEALQSCPIYSANLRHLTLFSARAWTDVNSMIQLFQSIPNLETFSYSFGAYSDELAYDTTPTPRYPFRAVSMKHMKSFETLDSLFVPGITIFCYLALPPDVRISFWWTSSEDVDEHEAGQLTQVLEHMRLASDALSQHFAAALAKGMRYFHSVAISGTDVTPLYHARDADDEHVLHDIDLAAPFVETREMLARVEPCLMTALQPVFLQATYLRLARDVSYRSLGSESHIWMALWSNLHRYQQVTNLHLFGENVVRFVSFLRMRMGSASPAFSQPLFPLLKSITLSDFDFTKRMHGDAASRHSFAFTLGETVKRAYGESESFVCVYVGATCKGHEEAVLQIRLSLEIDQVETDAEV